MMRNWMLVGGVLLAIALAPFGLVQAFPTRHSLTAHRVTFSADGREKSSVVWCSNMNLARIHLWRNEMGKNERNLYDVVVPGLRKTYFCPLGQAYCAITGRDRFLLF